MNDRVAKSFAKVSDLTAQLAEAQAELAEAIGMTAPETGTGSTWVSPAASPPGQMVEVSQKLPHLCRMGGDHTAYPNPDRFPNSCMKCGRHVDWDAIERDRQILNNNHGGVTS